jgi:CO/xanthine dehydrogenase FAD-binding subunit
MPAFDYYAPEERNEVFDLLNQFGEDARIIAGGQSLLILIRQGLVQPAVLISLDRIPSLKQISTRDATLKLGPMVTQSEVANAPVVQEKYSVLAQAASRVGSVHVQNLGTVGGNVSHAEPNGDSSPALIALGASVQISSSRGDRMIAVEDFFRGPFENVLEPDEALMEIHIPAPANDSSSVYLKHALRGIDRAIVGVGLTMELAGDVCRKLRIGLSGAAPTPIRAKEAEALLQGKAVTEALIQAVGAEVMRNCDPLSDGHGTAAYKRKMAGVFVGRAIRQIVTSRSK